MRLKQTSSDKQNARLSAQKVLRHHSLVLLHQKYQPRGWIKGFEVAREGIDSLEVTHLQYANMLMTLIFCDAEEG